MTRLNVALVIVEIIAAVLIALVAAKQFRPTTPAMTPCAALFGIARDREDTLTIALSRGDCFGGAR